MMKGMIFAASFTASLVLADGTTTSPSSQSTKPFSTKPTLQNPAPKKEQVPLYKSPKPTRPELPVMAKPFGMPGVIGFQNGHWEGTDYLGFLSNNISVDVEILKNANVPDIPSAGGLNGRIANIFTKENINPQANVAEGPPLPFFHVLILIYPIEKDRFALLGSGRLFEQIQVVRKDFVPQGIWQGITWETQDTAVATSEQLDAQVQAIAERIATAFAQRVRQYQESRPPAR